MALQHQGRDERGHHHVGRKGLERCRKGPGRQARHLHQRCEERGQQYDLRRVHVQEQLNRWVVTSLRERAPAGNESEQSERRIQCCGQSL